MEAKRLYKREELYILYEFGTCGMAEYYEGLFNKNGIRAYRSRLYSLAVHIHCEDFRRYFKKYHKDCPTDLGRLKHQILFDIDKMYTQMRYEGTLLAPHLENKI